MLHSVAINLTQVSTHFQTDTLAMIFSVAISNCLVNTNYKPRCSVTNTKC